MVIAPARRAGDPGSIPAPGENFSLKLLIYDLSEGYSKAKISSLNCNISYCERREVNNKINKFQRMCGTISRSSKGKRQLSTQIKIL